MEKFQEIGNILDSMKPDLEKFYEKGQNAAGTRIRKELNNIRKICADLRKEIQDIKTSRKS
ncbi:MAG: histone H1 [Ignavibacteriaceae bacterium]|jgi:Histone H1-like protein Hc1.|nr:MAG: histone H1 [Chlorobiota bacterium]KXK06047.1 MAG: hypothetical protein UZ04_CHB001000043 [Chlorobi bacterium OLB4]MBV6398482.1 hypothetical protein [Ignavibacteria bacterium]MCC6885716.1 histone H1 [Ignavibacteriales bacterium]MCE7953089.1 histone H1 [Chlorobi bacterium CHB7]MDL1887073.1 histone H1 [Ignavibacteria bacterium CHB1]MEB2329128.1 histone H1 [Ignavibacteriaceae bacterium]OQY77966.1 MAG: histone H1 [Ignavibacteriales bacterium UTCHB1]RIK49903.1 MAG: histone H1 [Ignavibacte